MSVDHAQIKLRRNPSPDPFGRISLHRGLRLNSQEKMLALATDMQKLNLSRRQIPDWMADRIYSYEGDIVDEDGQPVEVDDEAIDRAFNNDGSFRWLSDFFRVTREPPKQRAQRRIQQRLKLIYIALFIEYCVVNKERRKDSVTFYYMPDEWDLNVMGSFTYRRPPKICPPITGNLGQFQRFLQAWFSARAFRRAFRRHADRGRR